MDKPYRLACLVTHPIQYQAPLFRYLSACPEIDLTVFFMNDFSVRGYQDSGFGIKLSWDIPLLDGYKHIFLPAVLRRDSISFWTPLVHGIYRQLKNGRFDALWVNGYSHQACLRSIAIAKFIGMKVLLRGESHMKSHSRSEAKLFIKEKILPKVFKSIDGFLAIGTLNRKYYLQYGVPERKIFMMPYAVDNDFFSGGAKKAETSAEILRRQLDLKVNRPVVLYASKLQARKRPRDLLEAYSRLSPNGVQEPEAYLLFIGDGEERSQLEAIAKKLGWSSVKFLGFKNQTELPSYYKLCDVFVLPSEHEPWGLVVNEVMNAGKPVILSDHVGCGPDLVQDGDNGFIVPVGDIKLLGDRLKQLVSNRELAGKMGEESLKRIGQWSFREDLEGLLYALERVINRRDESCGL